jgi:hypothetical protein
MPGKEPNMFIGISSFTSSRYACVSRDRFLNPRPELVGLTLTLFIQLAC